MTNFNEAHMRNVRRRFMEPGPAVIHIDSPNPEHLPRRLFTSPTFLDDWDIVDDLDII
jgi:hypothetical protein